MKKLLLFSQLLLCTIYYSQTFQEITKIGSYYGKTFKEFENGMNMKFTERDSKFGIESRAYRTPNYALLISEADDNDLIGRIVFWETKILNMKKHGII